MSSPEREQDERQTRADQAKLRRAQASIESMRLLFFVVASGLAVLFAAAFFKSGRVDGPFVLLGLLVYGLPIMLGFALGGALLRRQPFRWSLILAVLMTPYALLAMWLAPAIMLVIAEASRDQVQLPAASIILGMGLLACGFQIFTTAMCWVGMGRIYGVKKLVRNQDDWATPQPADERAPAGSVRQRASSRGASGTDGIKMAAYIGIAIVVTSLVIMIATMSSGDAGSGNVYAMSNEERSEHQADLEESFKTTLDQFETTWHRSDREAILALVPPAFRQQARRQLERSLAKYGFEGELPMIAERRILWMKRDPNGVKAYFAVPAATTPTRAKLRTEWLFRDERWTLTSIGLRKTSR